MGAQRFGARTGVSQVQAKSFSRNTKERYPGFSVFWKLQERLALSRAMWETMPGASPPPFAFDPVASAG